eukprot:4615195-Prymnesium_polylepis.1
MHTPGNGFWSRQIGVNLSEPCRQPIRQNNARHATKSAGPHHPSRQPVCAQTEPQGRRQRRISTQIERGKGVTSTAHGKTGSWPLELGVGQGCVNATRRAELQIALIQRTVRQLCKGFDYSNGVHEAGCVPQVFYADDGAFLSDSLWGLQTALDACWWVCHIMGIRMIIKGKKKTAWQGRCWVGGQQQDVGGVEIRLPNGEEVPQLTGEEAYVHLGFEEGTVWVGRHKAIREKVVEHCKRSTVVLRT